jgi:hypothetical protein
LATIFLFTIRGHASKIITSSNCLPLALCIFITTTPVSGFELLEKCSLKVIEVITIENKTTFHSEAKRRQDEEVLLIYTAGMPSPAWRTMYRRLLESLPPATPISHWGDVDEGGFRIAATIAAAARTAGFSLQPYCMTPADVPLKMRVPASVRTLERIHHFACAAGWPELGQAMREAKFIAEQEALERE